MTLDKKNTKNLGLRFCIFLSYQINKALNCCLINLDFTGCQQFIYLFILLSATF